MALGYFFDKLTNPVWLKPLYDEGFFKHSPEPVRDEERGTIGFPPWPESRYLACMASKINAQETVLEIALQIPDSENVRVYEDLADVALAMPADRGAKLAPKARHGIELPYLSLLPQKLGALVSHLAKGGQVEVALDLASGLLAVFPETPQNAERGEAEIYRAAPQPRIRFDHWPYEQILKTNIPDLVDAAGEYAFTLLGDLLEAAVRFSRRREEDQGPEDYSRIWPPAIEGHSQNRPHGVKELLATAVRDAAERIVQKDPIRIPVLVEKLESRPWRIFHRIALHLLRLFPAAASQLVAERLTDRHRFDDPAFRHEYALLARDCFASLAPDDQPKILGWIAAGPELRQLPADGMTAEQIERHKRSWKLNRLAPIKHVLPPDWSRRYEEWVAELGESEHPEFTSYRMGGSVGPTSPKTADDFQSMSVDEIVNYLRTWQPSRELFSPTPEGLGRALSAAVTTDPTRFAASASQFKALDPTYVRALLQGLRDAAKQHHPLSWSQVVDLCQWVIEQPREYAHRERTFMDADPNWGWTRKAIAELLAAGFEEGPTAIPYELRSRVWEILQSLTEDPEPTPDYEREYGGSNQDPATLAINTTRGESMHAVIDYSLWVRRALVQQADAQHRTAQGFDVMPEVREILDAHLDPAQDPALAIRAVYGWKFPVLAWLDLEWARSRMAKIFPSEEQFRALRDAAWNTYVIFCEPYDDVFEMLQGEYARALDRLGEVGGLEHPTGNPEERLAEHLMVRYWHGKLALNEPEGLLTRFYRRAHVALKTHALGILGRVLRESEGHISEEILHRLRLLWENRLAAVRKGVQPATESAELAAFGWWFASGRFDDTWAMAQLAEALRLARRVEVDHLVVERLATVATALPKNAVECLRLMVEGDREGWTIESWSDHIRTILTTAIRGTNVEARQASIELVHILGARGHLSFRDLLVEAPSP